MTEFEPQTSGMESDRSTNCATTTALWTNDYLSIIFFQEFGQGARARRLYENETDEEEDKEAVILKENPKLQQGSTFVSLNW